MDIPYKPTYSTCMNELSLNSVYVRTQIRHLKTLNLDWPVN